MKELNEEQQRLVADSTWVVKTILKEQKQGGNEDLYQELMLYMCELALRYDKTKGAKWTTYAYKSLDLYARRWVAKEREIAKGLVAETDNQVQDEKANSHLLVENRDEIIALRKRLNEQEQQIFDMLLKDISQNDIGKALHYTRSYVNKVWHNIVAKAKAPPPKTEKVSAKKK